MSKLRTVLVGCGDISKVWLDAARTIPEVEIVGLVDVVEANAQARASEYQLTDVPISNDLAGILETLKPDAVFDCTVPGAHMPTTLMAFQHNCHVLGEKPMSDSLPDAQTMVSAAKASGKLYAVTEDRRYIQHAHGIRNFLATGEIGAINAIYTDFFLAAHYGGYRAQMEHVLMLDLLIHTFDVVRYFAEADPVSVYCKEFNPPGSWFADGAAVVGIFELSNGALFDFRGNWCAEGFQTKWNGDWRIVGEKGSVRWDGQANASAQIAVSSDFYSTYRDVVIPPYLPPHGKERHAAIMHEFVDAVLKGTPAPMTIGTDNVITTAMVFSAIESSRLGQSVPVKW